LEAQRGLKVKLHLGWKALEWDQEQHRELLEQMTANRSVESNDLSGWTKKALEGERVED